MRNAPSALSPRLPWFALASVVLLQAAGLVLHTSREGTPLGTFIFVHLRRPEALSILIEQAGVVLTVAGSIAAVFGRSPAVRFVGAAWASAFFALFAVMESVVGGAPYTSWAVPAHAARIVAPLLLVLWNRQQAALWVARIAVASTFVVHGVEAFLLHPQFVDFILGADLRLFGFGLSQSTAETLLRVIGVHDVLLALLVVSGRNLRPVLFMAAGWGFITAASRIVLSGSGGLHHTLIRAANGGVPLVLLLVFSRSFMNTNPFRLGGRLARTALPALLIAVVLPFAAHAQAIEGQKPAQLRVVWTESPAHQATVSWSTASPGSTHEVYVDTQPRGGDLAAYALKVPATENGVYDSSSPAYHHAYLTGLQPSTTYYFVMVSDGNVSAERHFITAPTDDRSFRLLFGGDSRSGVSDRQKMNQLMARLVEQDPGIVALAHGGDYIQTDNSWSEWNSWLNDHARTITATGRVTPIIPTRGNHEGDGSMFNEVFGFPGGKSVDYFTTKIGANFTYITLDSNVSMGGDQKAWLESQLQAAQAGRWIVPGYHRPAFPAVKTPSSALQYFVPLFEKYNVDVVTESDGHVLKRTVPIRNGKHDPTGVVYVGEGGLGVPQRTPISAWYLQSPGMAKAAHHVQLFSVTPQSLTYEARLMDGSVDDSYTFQPRRQGLEVEPEPQPQPQPEPQPGEEPAVTTVSTYSATEVAVTFSTDVTADTAANPASYTLAPDAAITDATLVSPRTAVLTTTSLAEGTDYVLTVSGVRSVDGDAMSSTAEITFRVGETTVTPLPEDPSLPGPGQEGEDSASVGCAAAAGGVLGWALLAAGVVVIRRRRAAAR